MVDLLTSTFLARNELVDLSGCQQRARVCAWLVNNSYQFSVAADGWPRVLRAAMEARLMPGSQRRTMRKSEPDFTAYGSTS